MKKTVGVALILVGIGLTAWAAVGWLKQSFSSLTYQETGTLSPTTIPLNTSTATPLWQAEPLIPTAPPSNLPTLSQTLSPVPTFSPKALPALPLASASALTTKQRFGIGVPHLPIEAGNLEELGVGWYLAWRVLETPVRPGGIEFWQIIRVGEEEFHPDKATIQRTARTNPGATWVIGNEPDVRWQDNVTPARYAEWYHDLYKLLKETDPTCQISIGPITQPTPLRLHYLEMVLSSYQAHYGQAMPIDIWNIHNFILREERDSWGVDIPPGLKADRGILYEVDDHDDLRFSRPKSLVFGDGWPIMGSVTNP